MAEKSAPKVQAATSTQKDIDENKIMAVLSYIGILVLIPLLAKKDSPYAQFHAKQGLVLLICGVALGVISTVAGFIAVIPVIGWIIGLLVGLAIFVAGIGLMVIGIMGIINSATGKMKELPIIGQYASKINI
jgi:uncharacterized membrane protein